MLWIKPEGDLWSCHMCSSANFHYLLRVLKRELLILRYGSDKLKPMATSKYAPELKCSASESARCFAVAMNRTALCSGATTSIARTDADNHLVAFSSCGRSDEEVGAVLPWSDHSSSVVNHPGMAPTAVCSNLILWSPVCAGGLALPRCAFSNRANQVGCLGSDQKCSIPKSCAAVDIRGISPRSPVAPKQPRFRDCP